MLLNKLNLNDIIEKNKKSNNVEHNHSKRDSEVSKTRNRYQSLNDIVISARNETN